MWVYYTIYITMSQTPSGFTFIHVWCLRHPRVTFDHLVILEIPDLKVYRDQEFSAMVPRMCGLNSNQTSYLTNYWPPMTLNAHWALEFPSPFLEGTADMEVVFGGQQQRLLLLVYSRDLRLSELLEDLRFVEDTNNHMEVHRIVVGRLRNFLLLLKVRGLLLFGVSISF